MIIQALVWTAGAGCAAVLAKRKTLEFFDRDPEREIPAGDHVLSPADGRIVEILSLAPGQELTIDKGLLGRIRTITADLEPMPLTLISIFMPPTAVHVQRAPVPGRVASVKHKKGRFRVTNTVRAIDNERSETIIDSPIGRVKVIQIAGFLARRIETWARPEENLELGQRMGRIRLGSQVSLILPTRADLEIRVRKGDPVRAGETVLATTGTER